LFTWRDEVVYKVGISQEAQQATLLFVDRKKGDNVADTRSNPFGRVVEGGEGGTHVNTSLCPMEGGGC